MAINFKELLKERKVKNAIVVGAAAIGLVVFLYVMFGGSDSKEERNDKEIIVGDEASMLNFGVPTTKDSALIALNKQQAYERKCKIQSILHVNLLMLWVFRGEKVILLIQTKALRITILKV